MPSKHGSLWDRDPNSLSLPRLLAQNPAVYKSLKTFTEAVLQRTSWPLESNETAQELLRVVQRSSGSEDRYSEPERATQVMQIVWQKVKEASLKYDRRNRGTIHQVKVLLSGGTKGCTAVLTTCRERVITELDPSQWRSMSLRKPLPPPSTLRNDENQQQSSFGRTVFPRLRSVLLRKPQPPPSTPRNDARPQQSSFGRTVFPRLSSDSLANTEEQRLRPSKNFPFDIYARRRSVGRIDSLVSLPPSMVSLPPSMVSLSPSMGSLPLSMVFLPASMVSLPLSVASSDSVTAVGTQITWISSTPVKVNGHFCDVFVGTHTRVGKVALKRPRIGAASNEDIMRRFQREAETWASLQHPHILEYLGTFQRDGHFYFVSPFIDNGTLVEYIVLHPNINRIQLLCQAADAVSYLHKEDVVHGDIKASNLFIGESGHALLCASVSSLTRPVDKGTSTEVKGAGTLRWQSPELLDGGSKSFKSDVYAFSMTIAEVLTGDVPFHDLRTDEDVIEAVRIKGWRPPSKPAMSSAGLSYSKVWAVARACWRTIPEKRISMSEALQMIQEDPALTVTQADPALPAIQDITSSSLVDLGSFITSISNDAVRLTGRFCDVFEGIHSTAGRVALKRPRIAGMGEEDATMRRFEREGIIWQRLRHPYILEFLGTFRRNQHLYLVSPFINNGTLIEYTRGHPETNHIRLLCETADAVNYLHQNNIVHGDIKGTNILIDDNIHCRLCDFGLSKMTDSRTSTAMRGAGTSRWQSPELLEDAPKSFSSDVYAFAMTIAEVLTGEVPFAHYRNDNAVITAVFQRDERPPEKPTESPSGVSYLGAWDVAEACWSRNPEERISMFTAFQRLQADPSSSIS